MEQDYRVPGAFIEDVEDFSWLDGAVQAAIWEPMVAHRLQNDWYDAKVDLDSRGRSTPGYFQQTGEEQEQDVVIAVMGATGSGKSTFIKTVSERNDVVVGNNLSSGSSKSSP